MSDIAAEMQLQSLFHQQQRSSYMSGSARDVSRQASDPYCLHGKLGLPKEDRKGEHKLNVLRMHADAIGACVRGRPASR